MHVRGDILAVFFFEETSYFAFDGNDLQLPLPLGLEGYAGGRRMRGWVDLAGRCEGGF
jgi:hypothetical protein